MTSKDLQLDHDALRKALEKIESMTGIDPKMMHIHTIACAALDDNERSQLWQPTILTRLKAALEERQAVGVKEYNTTLDNAGLSHHRLLWHLLEELLDASFYTMALGDALLRHDHLLALAEEAVPWLEAEGYVQNMANGCWERTPSQVLKPAEAVALYERYKLGLGYSDQF